MFAIFKREIKAYFYSPIAYVLIGLFIFVASFTFRDNLQNGYADFNGNLSFLGVIIMFIIPILTMRIIAEDRKNGTEVLLITSPVNLTSIVLGKYFAAMFVFIVMTVITFVYPIIMLMYGNPAVPQMIGGYIGFILLGAAFTAVGVFASSLTESQVIAAVISFVSLLMMLFMRGAAASFGGMVSKVLNWFSLLSRYEDFNTWILDISAIIYYLSFTAVFLFLAIRVIEKRRWSQG